MWTREHTIRGAKNVSVGRQGFSFSSSTSEHTGRSLARHTLELSETGHYDYRKSESFPPTNYTPASWDARFRDLAVAKVSFA